MRIALVHDDFMQSGGAESLFATIAEIFPEAPVYTSIVDWSKLPSSINKERVRTSFMQGFPFKKILYKILLPFYPLAFESFDFSSYDLVLSSTTRFAKSVITGPKTMHVSYINNVPRFLWDENTKNNYLMIPAQFFLRKYFNWLKRWDKTAAARVDHYIANSQNVAAKVKNIYGVNAAVIYPFANLDFFTPPKIHNWQLKNQNYYLVVSRLARWKRIDLAIKAINNTNFKLKIIGDGPDKNNLKRLKSSAVEFTGKVTLEQLRDFYQNSKGLIVTQEEDFGIASVEAQACGVPVIAFDAGGQKEIVKNEETGLFFAEQSPASLEDALERCSNVKWSTNACRRNAQNFSKDRFVKSLKKTLEEYVR